MIPGTLISKNKFILTITLLNTSDDCSRFLFVILADQITVIRNEMSVQTLRFANVSFQVNPFRLTLDVIIFDVRFGRLKSIPEMKELKIYNGPRPIT